MTLLPARAAGGGDAPPALRAPTHGTVLAAAPKMMLSGHSITAGPPGAGPGGPNSARHLGTNTPCKPSCVLVACTELCQKKKDFLEVQSCPALHQHPQFAAATGMGSYLDGGAGGDDARVVHGVAVVDVIGGRAFLRLGRHGDGDQARPGGEVHVGAVAKGLDGISWGGAGESIYVGAVETGCWPRWAGEGGRWGSALRRQGFSVKSLRNFSHSSSRLPLPLQEHQGEMVMLVVLAST